MYIIHLYIYFLHRGKKGYKKINTTGLLVYRYRMNYASGTLIC